MSWEQVAMVLLAVVSGVLGFLLRELWDAVKSLRKDLSDLEVKISDNYVKISAFDAAVNRILTAIERLRDDIYKVDKP